MFLGFDWKERVGRGFYVVSWFFVGVFIWEDWGFGVF